MIEIGKFQERIGEALEIAKNQDNKIESQKVIDMFADMELNNTQFNQIMAYLAGNKIDVQGYEPIEANKPIEDSKPAEDSKPIEDSKPTENLYQEEFEEFDPNQENQKEINTQDSVYLKQYLEELNEIREGSKEEEIKLLQRINTGDRSIKERFIEINLRKVVKIAGEYKNQGMTVEDLIQEGNIALIQSLDELTNPEDWESTKRFLEEAIRKGILAALEDQRESKNVENQVMEMSNRIYHALKELEEDLGRKASIHELAGYTKLTEDEIREIFELTADAMKHDGGHNHDHDHNHNQ